jgi:predicted metal-dependent hydrolase
MAMTQVAYHPRYLLGIVQFNRGDWFEAHEAWEDLWHESGPPQRRFYQGLIQAAVGLCHFHNGNLRGAVKLYNTSKDYMQPFQPTYQGLDVAGFWDQMQRCFGAALDGASVEMNADLAPTITLDPPPDSWPDPDEPLAA